MTDVDGVPVTATVVEAAPVAPLESVTESVAV